jgi:hypothetical protein
MKKLLFILLLSPVFCFGQIVITNDFLTTSQTTNATSFGLGPATFDAGKLYILVAQTTGTTNDGTVSSTTLTWTSIGSAGNSTNRIQLFRCLPGSTASGETVTVGTFGGGSTGYSIGIYEITGVVTTGTNGADAIVQVVSTGPTTSNNPSLEMGAISNPQNAIMTFWSNNTNPFGGTPASGWTEIVDGGYETPTTGYYEMRRIGTTDAIPTVTAASSTWIGIVFELQSSASRRIFSIN